MKQKLLIIASNRINNIIQYIQDILNYTNHNNNVHFIDDGIGKIGLTGFLIGLLLGFHFCLWLITSVVIAYHSLIISVDFITYFISVWQWSSYFSMLCLFHIMEFYITANYQPSTLSYDSFIVNHSKAYTLAALLSWFEFVVEMLLFGRYKRNLIIIVIGIFTMVVGQTIRTLAMITCGKHFSHQVMNSKHSQHQLVTNGIYSYLRHPSYFGWFWWSLGTQLVLCNPISLLAYTYASWDFFHGRIAYEELILVKSYGDKYIQYSNKTYIGIPFISSRKYN